jgi:hypothetical protein
LTSTTWLCSILEYAGSFETNAYKIETCRVSKYILTYNLGDLIIIIISVTNYHLICNWLGVKHYTKFKWQILQRQLNVKEGWLRDFLVKTCRYTIHRTITSCLCICKTSADWLIQHSTRTKRGLRLVGMCHMPVACLDFLATREHFLTHTCMGIFTYYCPYNPNLP